MSEKIYVSKITQDTKNSVKDCLLSLFYRKNDLIQFLKSCGSTSSDLINIGELMTKSRIVDTYFGNLEQRLDNGTAQYHSLMRQIIDWDDFDSYWFRNGSLDAGYAKSRIGQLNKLLGKKTKIEEERLKLREKEQEYEKIKARSQLITDLRDKFYRMCQDSDQTQKRGYELEDLLNKMFSFFGFDVFKPFKLKGEQIDGSFKHDGDNYIFESKWQDKESAVNDLYAFAYKIESNSLYPRGVFFSINGYSEDALNRITYNKKAQLILFDAVDIIAVLEERISLVSLLEEKIRFAQTHSRIYVNANDILK
ncbi:MAG: hypothetical protein UT24_C0012G0050 [Candidatus Woesebacteria bacterium GW2011_GWB1_39_12]|uniref:Restriction endonuclease type IV Mrr domain-containing protein n=2 Tax=Candidatus Woeseibacteriota TaxID=1752722 RepID=A0A0G0PI17_9BACT|nr:MAG: hypothetical protein UT23_C0008G0012 [Candidatus Woesebacteria bacterium GW2011_GWA1_39_12]KKR00428.1 MAG: hypothetical protein UT24_C0012G0050 [Candidatus Woesebacteria bacterium GW2011_GWB1_39_12]